MVLAGTARGNAQAELAFRGLAFDTDGDGRWRDIGRAIPAARRLERDLAQAVRALTRRRLGRRLVVSGAQRYQRVQWLTAVLSKDGQGTRVAGGGGHACVFT